MDPLTHGLAGAVVRKLGFKWKGAFFVLVVASIAPDIDYITMLIGKDVFLKYHRGITHGLPALFAVSASVLILIGLNMKGIYYSALTFIGYGLHIVFDVVTHHGVRIFYPLDHQFYSLYIIPGIDPYISIGLLMSLILTRMNKDKARIIALATILIVVSYVGVRKHYRDGAFELLRSSRNEYIVSSICPLPNDFLRWWFVARDGDGIKTGFADLFMNEVYLHKKYPSQVKDPVIEATKQLSEVLR
jgi:inner membrane protein